MATTNDLKTGLILQLDGNLWKVLEFQHVKPGKGGAFVRTKIKNIENSKVIEKTFNAGVKIETVNVDRRDMQYLYSDGKNWTFMDSQTFENIDVPLAIIGDAKNFLKEGIDVVVAVHNDRPLYIDMPHSVDLQIKSTEPGIQGNRSNAGNKPATTEIGSTIQVPLFINEGDTVKIETKTGNYISRA